MCFLCVQSKRFAHDEEIRALYLEMESQISAEKERIRAEVFFSSRVWSANLIEISSLALAGCLGHLGPICSLVSFD